MAHDVGRCRDRCGDVVLESVRAVVVMSVLWDVMNKALGRRVGAAGLDLADSAAARLAGSGVPVVRAVGAGRDEIWPHVRDSPHQIDGRFANPEPVTPVDTDLGLAMEMMRSRRGRPRSDIRVLTPEFHAPDHADNGVADLAATWLGHATVLVELDGVTILTDPVLSRRCSPSQLVGPARMHRAPTTVAQLPTVDVVLISHDHYDHLDHTTVLELAAAMPDAVFVVPVGVGAHLILWGVGAERIHEADWGDELTVNIDGTEIRFAATPARHFSGRFLLRNLTQWVSWAVHGPRHRVFFSGDTGYTERFAEVGASHGPFDLTLIAIGAYDPLWPDIHLDPEQAVAVHRMVSGEGGRDSVMLPIHWGTFDLARHSWADPVARVLPSAGSNETTVLIPTPGGRFDVIDRIGSGLADPQWWEVSA